MNIISILNKRDVFKHTYRKDSLLYSTAIRIEIDEGNDVYVLCFKVRHIAVPVYPYTESKVGKTVWTNGRKLSYYIIQKVFG